MEIKYVVVEIKSKKEMDDLVHKLRTNESIHNLIGLPKEVPIRVEAADPPESFYPRSVEIYISIDSVGN